MGKILLVGATGYLGGYILKELLEKGFDTRIVVRNEKKIPGNFRSKSNLEIIKGELTNPSSVLGSCKDIDTVISTVGITKQKDGLTYMDVDYRANLNVLNEAVQQGVRRFIYISVLNGEKLKDLAICQAKEKFVAVLKCSKLSYCVVRPNGFFSDMSEFYEMAKNGRMYLFGKGTLKSNPIHGIDLAKECVNQIETTETELNIGGPETLTQNEIAEIAFSVTGNKSKIVYIPNWIRKIVLRLAKIFLSKSKYGPIEFFMNVMAIEMVAPEYGKHTLKKYFEELEKR